MTQEDVFGDIRPYNPDELPQVFEELIQDEGFREAVGVAYQGVPFEQLVQAMRGCTDNLDFQRKLVYPMLKQLLAKASKGLEADFSAIDTTGCQSYTFVSNHRDIVLDSAFLDVALVDKGMKTIEIAIGDNLLIKPWIKKLVRVNKSFIVQRSLTMREILLASAKMSRYMHYAINVKHEGIWIAQREGRAKDSDDRTQDSVLKMMAMGGEGSLIERLKDLHIVPLSISYEYDPCDYLKAEEFQQKRDVEGFKKSQQDDLDNMRTGIFGYKGQVTYHAAPCINDWLDTLDPAMSKQVFFRTVGEHIDHEIHAHYRIYPGNARAADLLDGGTKRHDLYTDEQAVTFDRYVESQLAKVTLPHADGAFLRERLLTMYANPVFNHEKALS